MRKVFLPILIIAVGTGWLLSAKNIMPGVDWALVLSMSSLGLLILLSKLSPTSIVLGPILLLSAFLMVMLQSHQIDVDLFLPIIVISFGLLMLISRFIKINPPGS